jgi:hypothetical protein
MLMVYVHTKSHMLRSSLVIAIKPTHSGRKISASLGYVTVREEGDMEGARREQDVPSSLSLVPQLCVFVVVNETQRYLAALGVARHFLLLLSTEAFTSTEVA